MPRSIATSDADFEVQLQLLTRSNEQADAAVVETVRGVLSDVRDRGDAAVLDYTQRFDGHCAAAIADLRIPVAALDAAMTSLAQEDRVALLAAAARIREFHEHQRQQSWSYVDEFGNELGQRVTPLRRVGIYVPGGQAAYPSTLLMTAIPAQVAGVDEIVVTLPTPNAVRNPLVLAAAAAAGVNSVYAIGGAQAIAALAYGTASLPRVDKILGPGGAYVAEAKRQVFGPVAIDMIAGPSEILMIADDSADPRWLALDLFAQAEHDALAQAILLSPSAALLARVRAAMVELLPTMQRKATISASLSERGALIHTADLAEAVMISNRVAPEHLALHLHSAAESQVLSQVRNAGAIFAGALSAEVMGDYAAGPSHVLPTFGTARYASPLGVYDFVKRSSMIRLSSAGVHPVAQIAATLARGEGLDAHAQAAEVRMRANRVSD